MGTHNIHVYCYGELQKIIPELSSNTPLNSVIKPCVHYNVMTLGVF